MTGIDLEVLASTFLVISNVVAQIYLMHAKDQDNFSKPS